MEARKIANLISYIVATPLHDLLDYSAAEKKTELWKICS